MNNLPGLNFQLGEDIDALRDAVRDFAQAEIAPRAAEIDRKFENSSEETKTQSEQEFQLGFLKQLGDIGFIVNAISGAVFFTILILTGYTMSQAVRERIPELAVLKCLGFTDRTVLGLVLAESFLLCFIGALFGLLLASVWSWAIILERSRRLSRLHGEAAKFEDWFWKAKDLDSLY